MSKITNYVLENKIDLDSYIKDEMIQLDNDPEFEKYCDEMEKQWKESPEYIKFLESLSEAPF